MNIFYLARDPFVAAEMLCDKHLVKMILETAQLLSSVHHVLKTPMAKSVYKLTHVNHPCAKWARANSENYRWLANYGIGLLMEYSYRYGKIHKSADVITDMVYPPNSLLRADFEVPPKCMPDEYKNGSTVTAYRRYYLEGKKHIQKRWTKRSKPAWHK